MKRSIVCALSAAALTFAAHEAHAGGPKKQRNLNIGTHGTGLPVRAPGARNEGYRPTNDRGPTGHVTPIDDRRNRNRNRRRGRGRGRVQRGTVHVSHSPRNGEYIWRNERVWVPAHFETQWIERRTPDRWEARTVKVKLPDRHEWRARRVFQRAVVTFRQERYVVRPGRWVRRPAPNACPPFRRVWCPPVYGMRRVRCETPGRWIVKRERVCIPGGYTTKCERVLVPGCVRKVKTRVHCAGHYENKRVKVWVSGAACTPRTRLVIGGNHGGFGFSLNLSR